MTTVKQMISKKNDLVMQMAFSVDITEVRELMKRVRAIEHELKVVTLN